MRDLREETVLRPQPEPLDGGHEAALQPQPPARTRPARRQGDARVRLHALPQGQQGSEGRLGSPADLVAAVELAPEGDAGLLGDAELPEHRADLVLNAREEVLEALR